MNRFRLSAILSVFILYIAASAQAVVWSQYFPGNVYTKGIFMAGQQVDVLGATPFVLEGATVDSHETTIAVTDPTADRTITLPDDSGDVPVSDKAVHMISVLQANLAIASIASQTCSDTAITVSGAAVGDSVSIGPPATLEAGLSVSGYVSDADTVQLRLCNPTAADIDPADTNSWRVTVLHY